MSASTGPRSQKEARQVLARAVAKWLAEVSLEKLVNDAGMTDVQWKRLEDAADELGALLQKRAGEA